MIKNIVFDLGGVVVEWHPEHLLEAYPGDKELPLALFRGGFFERYWTQFDRGVLTQTEVSAEMSRFTGRTYAECWDFMEYIKHFLVNIPETEALIRELAGEGYRLFCLSNMSAEYYDYMKDRDVFRLLEGHLISAHEKVIKPEEAIYRLLLERYGLKAEETLFIDDLKPNVEAAERLGIRTVHFTDRNKGVREVRERLRQA